MELNTDSQESKEQNLPYLYGKATFQKNLKVHRC